MRSATSICLLSVACANSTHNASQSTSDILIRPKSPSAPEYRPDAPLEMTPSWLPDRVLAPAKEASKMGFDRALRVYKEPQKCPAKVKAITGNLYSSAKGKSHCMVSCGLTAEW